MKRIFGRDKPKMAKVTDVGREIIDITGVGPTAGFEENPQYLRIYNQQRTVPEAVPQRSPGRPSTDANWEGIPMYKDDANQVKQQYREHEQMQNSRSPALLDSRSSSLASLPPGAPPPIPSPHTRSPFSAAAVSATQGPPAGTPHGGPTALGIFKALDPFAMLGAPADNESKSHHGHYSDEGLGDEMKEKKSFWTVRDKDKDKERDKGKERKDEDGSGELRRMIGALTATASEDWSLVLEVCDRASASEANAKEAVRALRIEFKYSEPLAQLSAARLWAIMLRNSSEIFMRQIMSRKFLNTLEDVLTWPKTSPVVRERLMDVLATVAYASRNNGQSNKDGFRGLWRRLKPADKPDEGVPFDIDDAMFNPPMPRPTSEYSLEPQVYPNQSYQIQPNSSPPLDPQEPPVNPARQNSTRRHQIIPPEEDIRRLFRECKIGMGHALLLSKALAYTRPEDLEKKEIIHTIHENCRASQELIFAQIPWASAGAERSRLAKGPPANSRTQMHPNGSYPSLQLRDEEAPRELTLEEELLAALLDSNETLLEALRVYDGLKRLAVEREVGEISRRDVRMDRRQLQYKDEYGGQLESPTSSPHIPSYPAQNVGLVPPPAPRGPRSPAQIMGSRTPSPERTDSSTSSLDQLQIGDRSTAVEDDEEFIAPFFPSLGTRKVVEAEEPDRNAFTTSSQAERLAEMEKQPRDQHSSQAQRAQMRHSNSLFMHSAVLPTLKITLHDALAADLPLCNSPVDYIYAEANYVNNVIQELLALTQRKELISARFTGRMIYQRLIVYNFAHLMFCTSHESLLDEFEETLRQWRSWDNITVIQNHQLIKDNLLDLFRRGLNVQSNSILHSEEVFHQVAALDVAGLCAQLTDMVTDNGTYKKMLTRRGPAAQSLLNLLQAHLEFPKDPRHKSRLVKVLLRLSRASGLYPECLALKSIEMEAHPVDRGGYGDVYKGVLHGQKIAVKMLRVYKTSDLVKLVKEFSFEAVIWRQLSHPNVLPFYGIYHLDETTPRLCLAAPWMENGNVVEFLKQYPDTYCVHLALDMAQGLEYLHSRALNIIHGDLKGVNVLITQGRRACLADFGHARVAMNSKTISVTHSSTGKTGGTMRWQAPELLGTDVEESESYQYCGGKASDIYAFACVCYEMFSGEVPFFESRRDVQVFSALMRGKRPTRPLHDLSKTRGFSDEVWDLVQACWTQDPAQRPAAEQVLKGIRALPNWQNDQRPLDSFNPDFPSQTLYKYMEHPFSTLATAGQAVLAW